MPLHLYGTRCHSIDQLLCRFLSVVVLSLTIAKCLFCGVFSLMSSLAVVLSVCSGGGGRRRAANEMHWGPFLEDEWAK